MPYVPFITSTTGKPTASGLCIALDTTITRAIYDNLQDDWRSEDVVGGNSSTLSHPSWHFKQLHVKLKPDTSIALLIKQNATSYPAGNIGNPDGKLQITFSPHQDSIVVADTSDLDVYTGGKELAANPLVEIEILTTFRTTVRVRSLDWQDSIADRFFYRKRYATDSTHSLNSDGNYGGLDDSLARTLDTMAGQMPPNTTRELLYSDTPVPGFLGHTILSLVEYLG